MPTPEELELEREMEYFADPDDRASAFLSAIGANIPASSGPTLRKKTDGGGSEARKEDS